MSRVSVNMYTGDGDLIMEFELIEVLQELNDCKVEKVDELLIRVKELKLAIKEYYDSWDKE